MVGGSTDTNAKEDAKEDRVPRGAHRFEVFQVDLPLFVVGGDAFHGRVELRRRFLLRSGHHERHCTATKGLVKNNLIRHLLAARECLSSW